MSMFIARHGRRGDGERLSTEGISDAHRLADCLGWLGIDAGALYLSSSAKCAVETARLIRRQLRNPEQPPGRVQVKSHYMYAAGLRPILVGPLQEYADKILESCGLEPAGKDTVIVTHAPLANAVAGEQTDYGMVTKVPDGWVNPRYDPDFAKMLQQLPYDKIPGWIN